MSIERKANKGSIDSQLEFLSLQEAQYLINYSVIFEDGRGMVGEAVLHEHPTNVLEWIEEDLQSKAESLNKKMVYYRYVISDSVETLYTVGGCMVDFMEVKPNYPLSNFP